MIKLKVTVELEEGTSVTETREHFITAEAIIKFSGDDFKLEKIFRDEAARAAERAMAGCFKKVRADDWVRKAAVEDQK